MSHSTITVLFYVTLVLGMGIGIGLFIWWAARFFKPTVRTLESIQKRTGGDVSVDVVGTVSFVTMLPGTLMFFACCIPLFYFHNLLKRFDYCTEVVRVNRITSAQDEFLKERCARLDLQEVLKAGQAPRKPE